MRWSINVLPNEIEAAAQFCRDRDLGLEVTAFAFPKVLDEIREEQIALHRAHLINVGPLSLHGPYLDLYPASPDPELVRISQRRHEAGMTAAERLGVQLYVGHLNFVPLIRNPDYRAKFVERTAGFWRPLGRRAAASGITIVLENMWEPDPSLQVEVIRLVDLPNVKASFDNGHALIYSSLSAADWIRSLGRNLAHCHLHDNDKSMDQHRAVRDGVEQWPSLLLELRRSCPEVICVLESDTLKSNARSWDAVSQYLTESSAW